MKAEPDFHIIFNGNDFPINKMLFSYYSGKCLSHTDNQIDSKIIIHDQRVTCDEFDVFVKACQQDAYSINPSNFYPLKYLAKKYEAAHLMKECNEFLKSSNKSDLVLPKLFYKKRKGTFTIKDLKDVSNHLPNVISSKELLKVSNDDLKEIIKARNRDSTNQFQIFCFLIKKYEISNDVSIGELFKLLDYNKFSGYEINWLLSHPEIDSSYLDNNLKQRSQTIIDEIQEHDNLLKEYSQREINPLDEKKYKHVFSNLNHLKKKFNKNVSKALSEIEAESFSSFNELEKKEKIDEINNEIEQMSEKLMDIEAKMDDLEFKSSQISQYIETRQ